MARNGMFLAGLLLIVVLAASGCASKETGSVAGATAPNTVTEYGTETMGYMDFSDVRYRADASLRSAPGRFIETKRVEPGCTSGLVCGYIALDRLPIKVVSSDKKMKLTISSAELSSESYSLIVRGNFQAGDKDRSVTFRAFDAVSGNEVGIATLSGKGGTAENGDFEVSISGNNQMGSLSPENLLQIFVVYQTK